MLSVMMRHLRTTVPLGSYIRNFFKFRYYASLSACCQNLEKMESPGKFGRKRGSKFLRDLTEKSVNFSASATSDIKVSLFCGEVDQQSKFVRLVKKTHYYRKKHRKMTLFNEPCSLPKPKGDSNLSKTSPKV